MAEMIPCRTMDPDIWFPASDNEQVAANAAQIDYAKSLCHRCPIEARCLEDALRQQVAWGVQGGASATERRKMLGTMRRKGKDATPAEEAGQTLAEVA
jgi:hypothetical protein